MHKGGVMTDTFANRIRTYRKKAGLTQPILAQKVGVSQSTLARWESGAREPSLKILKKISDLLGIPLDILAFGAMQYDMPNRLKDIDLPKVPLLAKDSVVAFQGELGAYSNLAIKALYPHVEVLPCASFADAFQAVENGTATVAVIPIENSLGGRVADIHHLLPESNLHIVGEHFQPVEHCLLGVKGARLEDIKSVYSHEQALSQCRHRLRDMDIEPRKHTDTAGAAHFVSCDKDMKKGALASKLAAQIYGLTILQENMEDTSGNTTRFIVLSRDSIRPNSQAGQIITSCIFFTRDIPASLYKALGGFATNGVNIRKLESYVPMLEKSGDAHFYVEFMGATNEHSVALALEELKFFTTHIRILGSYTENK